MNYQKYLTIKNSYFKIAFALFFALLFLIHSSATAQVAGSTFDLDPMHWARYWARGVFDRNLVYSPIWNHGNLTDSGVDPSNPLQWPGTSSSSGRGYVGKANFYVANMVTDMSNFRDKVVPETWDGKQLPLISHTYLPHVAVNTPARLSTDRTHQQIWQPIPGYFNDGKYGFIWGINEDTNRDGELAPTEDVNFNGDLDLNIDPPASILKSMAISSDKRTWPEYWPGGSYIEDDRPPAGRPPHTAGPGSRVGRWNGEYGIKTIADQETYYMMDDHENDYLNDHNKEKYWPMKNPDGTPDTRTWAEGGIAGMGIEVENRTYAWFHPLAEDLLVSVHRVRNYSDYVLNRFITGMYVEANVGGSDYNTANAIMATYDYEGSGGRLDFDILYQWQRFPEQVGGWKKLGVFAMAFLETPGIYYNGVDDDADGIIDESMSNGIDDDGDWKPFADIGLDKLQPGDEGYKGPDLDGTEGNGKWDTEDLNLNGALDPGEDKNKNDKLDMEPVNDDRGSDGVGPDENGWPGPDVNGTEVNGIHDLGEPNFDVTDIDEADQAGLKHVYVYESNKDLLGDQAFWDKYLDRETPEPDVEETDESIVFTFGSRNVQLIRDEWKRFTIAVIMGEDTSDAIRNKATMQNIYDNNYRFLTPPLQPTLVSNVADREIQLYWDTEAEGSKDPFYGNDFNGYRVYKSTDPKFLDIKTVSDAFGNVLIFKPVAIYDKQDGLRGAHPIPFPNLGVHYDMGNDTGLRHSYRDTLVENGRTYYYAVTAIDAGNAEGFYERRIITEDYPLFAMPSESPFNITVNPLGEVVFRDRNTAVCVPTEPAAGFTEPFVDSLKIDHVTGNSRGGIWNIGVINKEHVNLEHEYELTFTDDGWLQTLTPLYEWGSTTGITCMNLTTGDTVFNYKYDNSYDFERLGYPEIEKSVFEGLKFDLDFPVNSGGRTKGISIVKTNEEGRKTNEWKKWATDSKSNLRVEDIILAGDGQALPVDVEIRVENQIGVDTSLANGILVPSFPLNFSTWDITDPDNPKKMDVIIRYDKEKRNKVLPPEMYGQIWDSTRLVLTIPSHNGKIIGSWILHFFKNKYDTLNPVIPPAPGDIYRFRTERNPTHFDSFRFKVEGGTWSADLAKEKMHDIYVVPDPYVASSTLEPIYELAGYSQRRVDFVNLPPECTIKIFTASGKLVKTIEHRAAVDFGRHSWDLATEDGPEIAFGIYFFVVESKDLGITRGKFAVIK